MPIPFGRIYPTLFRNLYFFSFFVYMVRCSTSFVDPNGLKPFLASRLIALDKCPGVCRIGVGEVVSRILGKAILRIIGQDIQEVAGPLQLCAGQDSGCEAVVHALRQLFESPDCEAVLLVDASNAFNSLNRQNALRNILHLHVCPTLSTILIISYRSDTPLFIDGEALMSSEGTTQGDPLAMAMYAIGILPLIRTLHSETITQAWFADDAGVSGKLIDLHSWWNNLKTHGPMFGYFPNAQKCWLVIKKDLRDDASMIFKGTGINITNEGRRYLGGAIGSNDFICKYIQEKSVVRYVRSIHWHPLQTLNLILPMQHLHMAYPANGSILLELFLT